jgi:hypothetical protein
MTRHVSTENLARFRAGDLSPARSRRVAAHLRNCARCRETSDALARVPSLLAAVEVPPMPAHLAARIETALAAESAHRAAGAPSPASAPERPARHSAARRKHRRPVILSAPALRVLAVAGAAVVLVGGGVELLSHATGASSGTSSGSSSASRSDAAPAAGHRAAGPRASSGRNFNGMTGPIQYQHDGRPTVITPVQTGTNYRSARLTQQVSSVIAAHRGQFSSAVPAVTPNSGTAAPPRTLSGCVSRIAAGRTVLLVDVARFDHKPATIIVTARQGASAAQVWVVGLGCSATASDVLAHRALSGH